MQIDVSPGVVVKRAETPSEAARLANEADILSIWSHPGLVHLIRRFPVSGPNADEMATAAAVGGSLAEISGPPLDLLAGWTAAIATVLDDLHSVGLAHGAVTAEHILFDGQGRPVMCGLGHAIKREEAADFDSACATDLRTLASLVVRLATPSRDTDRLARRLARWERSLGRRSGPAPGRSLAAAIVAAVPSARVGRPAPADLETLTVEVPASPLRLCSASELTATVARVGRRLGWRRAAVVGIPACVLIVVGLLVAPLGGSPHQSAAAASASPASAPPASAPPASAPPASASPASASPAPAVSVATISSSYQLKTPSAGRALTVLGRWGCGEDRPAVLYLGDDTVWVFSSWPAAGTSVGAVDTATVAGATGLAVQGTSVGCDQIVVLRGSSPPLTLVGGPAK